jgi:hypothetical protein
MDPWFRIYKQNAQVVRELWSVLCEEGIPELIRSSSISQKGVQIEKKSFPHVDVKC